MKKDVTVKRRGTKKERQKIIKRNKEKKYAGRKRKRTQ